MAIRLSTRVGYKTGRPEVPRGPSAGIEEAYGWYQRGRIRVSNRPGEGTVVANSCSLLR